MLLLISSECGGIHLSHCTTNPTKAHVHPQIFKFCFNEIRKRHVATLRGHGMAPICKALSFYCKAVKALLQILPTLIAKCHVMSNHHFNGYNARNKQLLFVVCLTYRKVVKERSITDMDAVWTMADVLVMERISAIPSHSQPLTSRGKSKRMQDKKKKKKHEKHIDQLSLPQITMLNRTENKQKKKQVKNLLLLFYYKKIKKMCKKMKKKKRKKKYCLSVEQIRRVVWW